MGLIPASGGAGEFTPPPVMKNRQIDSEVSETPRVGRKFQERTTVRGGVRGSLMELPGWEASFHVMHPSVVSVAA